MSDYIGNTGAKPLHLYDSKDEIKADVIDTSGRTEKSTDVLVFARIGPGRATAGKDAMLFKQVRNNSAFTKLRNFLMGRHPASAQNVYEIFRTHGMNKKQARQATENVRQASTGLSGLSANAVKVELKAFRPPA